MNYLNKSLFVFALLCMVLSSCISNKKVIYMQDLEDSSGPLVETSKKYPYNTEDYLLQINDIVEVTIKTTDPQMNLIFGAVTAENQNANQGSNMGAGDAFFMNGYTLDEKGMVEIPLIGNVKLLGLTTAQSKILVENKVKNFVKEGEYFVRVRLGGIRYSALGEFNRSGKFTILQNSITIFEAIANAGDLSNVAKRDEILLIRQYPDGSQIHKINLLDRNLLGSEYYFLRPNDLIYAEPMKVKEIGAGNTLVESLSLIITSITAVALVFTLVQNN